MGFNSYCMKSFKRLSYSSQHLTQKLVSRKRNYQFLICRVRSRSTAITVAVMNDEKLVLCSLPMVRQPRFSTDLWRHRCQMRQHVCALITKNASIRQSSLMWRNNARESERAVLAGRFTHAVQTK